MTDLPNPAADGAANVPTPDGETPAGDPELAALVRADAALDAGDPELAALVSPAAGQATPEEGADATVRVLEATAAAEDSTSPAPDVLTDTTLADTSPTSEPDVDAVPVLPLAAAVTEVEPPARPRRRRSLALRFGVSFVLGFLLAIGIGAGVLYAWDQQYDGRVLPGVRVGSTELGGLTREQAGAAIATAYASLGDGQIELTGPDGQTTTVSYADVGRGPDTSALLDAAFAAGRQGDPLATLIGGPLVAIHGVTLDPAVAYDRDKLAAAVDTTRVGDRPDPDGRLGVGR